MNPAPSLQGVQVLVADDHDSIRDVIEQALALHGAVVTCVEEGGAAMAALYTSRFDVFLTDLHMPGVDGVGLIEVAASIDPTLPVLVVTGFAHGERAEASVRAGAVELIEKPFELPALVQSVLDALAAKSTSGPSTERLTWWLEAEGVVRRADREALPERVAALAAGAWGVADPGVAGAVADALVDANSPLRVRATVEASTLTVWRMGETFPRVVRPRPDPGESAAA